MVILYSHGWSYPWAVVLSIITSARRKETRVCWELILFICRDMCARRDIARHREKKSARKNIILLYFTPRCTHTGTHRHDNKIQWHTYGDGASVDDTAAYGAGYKERLHAYVQFSRQERATSRRTVHRARENFLRPRTPTMEPTRWIDRVCLPREKACGSVVIRELPQNSIYVYIHITLHIRLLRLRLHHTPRVNYQWLHYRFISPWQIFNSEVCKVKSSHKGK